MDYKRIRLLSLLLFCFTIFFSCNEDDDEPSFANKPEQITDMVVFRTDSKGKVTSLRTDDGKTLTVQKCLIEGTVADTAYRYMCLYQLTKDKSAVAVLEGFYPTMSSYPFIGDKPSSEFFVPVEVVSTWNSGGYLNAHIEYKGRNAQNHSFAFWHEGITVENGLKTAKVHFVHYSTEAQRSYSITQYTSLPLGIYNDIADSISLTISTESGPVSYGCRVKS